MQNGKPFILVLDDSTSLHKMIEIYLRQISVSVFIHYDYRQIRKDSLSDFDVALIDINLGDDDGILAAQYLDEFGLSCPKIAMSGYHQKLNEDVFSSFFAKPPSKPFLLDLLAQHIRIEVGECEINCTAQQQNMSEEMLSGVHMLEKGIARQSCSDIQRACHILSENALLHKIPSFTQTVKTVQTDAKRGAINLVQSTDLLHFIKGMMHVQPSSRTQHRIR